MIDVLFVGDSLFANFEELQKIMNSKNMAVGGNKTVETAALMRDIRLCFPKKLIMMIGINDFLCNKKYWTNSFSIPFEKTYDALLELIKSNLPETEVILVSILPICANGGIEERFVVDWNKEIDIINKFIEKKSLVYQMEYLDAASSMKDNTNALVKEYTIEGIHLTQQGYSKLFEVIQKVL